MRHCEDCYTEHQPSDHPDHRELVEAAAALRRAGAGVPDPFAAGDARPVVALVAFLAACRGTGQDPTPLEWLAALLIELEECHWPRNRDDPEAAWSALLASRGLLHALRAAVALATED